MKNKSNLFWPLVTVGALGFIFSVVGIIQGKEFNDYFWGGLMGIILIGSAFVERNKAKKED